MTAMQYLSEAQMREIRAQAFATDIADQARALLRVASHAGLVLEIHSVADAIGVVVVRPRDPHVSAKRAMVPA